MIKVSLGNLIKTCGEKITILHQGLVMTLDIEEWKVNWVDPME
jgi:hypothetical protein